MQPIIVGVVLALLVGGSAPWWWGEIGTGGGSTETTSSTQVTMTTPTTSRTTNATRGTTGTNDGDTSTESIDVADCRITIRNPLVTLREEPDPFGLEVGKVEPGTYAVEEAAIVDRGLGRERWFRISADGRSGWLADSSILIDSKSPGCP